MSILDALAGGLRQGAMALAQTSGDQLRANIEQSRALAIEQARADIDFKSRKRELEELGPLQVEQRKREAQGVIDVELDDKNLDRKTKARVGLMQSEFDAEREEAINRGSDPEYLRSTRNIAAAGRAPSDRRPQISFQQAGDGRLIRIVDGKPDGYLKDPETGKDIVGRSDVSEATLAMAKSYFTEADALQKDGYTKEAGEKADQGRRLLMGQGGSSDGPQAPPANRPPLAGFDPKAKHKEGQAKTKAAQDKRDQDERRERAAEKASGKPKYGTPEWERKNGSPG